jgi:hypothetical protein
MTVYSKFIKPLVDDESLYNNEIVSARPNAFKICMNYIPCGLLGLR